MSKRFPQSTIFSFEPLQLNMDTLLRIKKKFDLNNVQEYQLAVGEKEGIIEMVMPVINNVPMHGLSHVVHPDNKEFNEGNKYEVQMICLDNFDNLINTDKDIVAMKIDVENFEYFVLKGGKNLIGNHKPIIYCELWDNDNRKKCIELLNNLNYSAFILHKKELVAFENATVNKHNFFFMPNT